MKLRCGFVEQAAVMHLVNKCFVLCLTINVPA
jgi:hypothetical protein